MKHFTFLALVVLICFVAGLSGCAAYRPFQIEPVGKTGTVIAPTFSESYYYVDQDHTLWFVMRSHTVDKATQKAVDQVATVRVFWRPVGGRTSMNKTSLNATYRYVLMTPDAVGMYEGAGFVRLWGKDGDSKITARLMDGDLRLTESSAGFVDTLGRSKVRGVFKAKFDDVKAMDLLLASHQEFFLRSMGKKMVEAPATMPTTRGAPVDFPTQAVPMVPATQP